MTSGGRPYPVGVDISDFPVFFHIFNFDICHEIQTDKYKYQRKSVLLSDKWRVGVDRDVGSKS